MSGPRYYMACLDLREQPCLVVGGGKVAAEKTDGLLAAGAVVMVVAPQIDQAIRGVGVTCLERPFGPTDLDGQQLVIAATDDRAVNQAVSQAAASRGIFCNVADDPALCSFILPAVVDQDPILVGVSTGGASPAVAQRIRDDISDLLGPHHADLARTLQALRPWAKANLGSYEERRDFFQRLVTETLG